jgi:hypothetical protein
MQQRFRLLVQLSLQPSKRAGFVAAFELPVNPQFAEATADKVAIIL